MYVFMILVMFGYWEIVSNSAYDMFSNSAYDMFSWYKSLYKYKYHPSVFGVGISF